MGMSGRDVVSGDAEHRLTGAIALVAVPAEWPTVSDDGAAMEQHRRRDPTSRVPSWHSLPPRSTCTWG
jgi:hypothetical protein